MIDTLDVYRADIDRHDRITPAQEQTADTETLVTANLKLVWKIAGGYDGRGVGIKDLISAGNVGLIRAAQKFDPSRGFRFSTYAAWWIKQNMMREIERQGSVKYPNNVLRDAQKLARNNYDPYGLDMSGRAYELAQRAFLPGLSLSDPINGKYRERKETLIRDNSPDQHAEYEHTRQVEFLEYCLSRLDARDADIVRRHFGIGRPPETLQAAGDAHGVSRERARQIIAASKQKLQFLKREGAEWATA